MIMAFRLPGGSAPRGAGRSFPRRGHARVLLPFLLLGCGDEGATGPDPSNLEVVVLSGNGQFAEPGEELSEPLSVRVQELASGKSQEGIRVRWEVEGGGGASLDSSRTFTDSVGVASVRLWLGESVGVYSVRASVLGATTAPAVFSAQAVLTPELTLVPTDPVRAGDTIQLAGRNLSSNPPDNVVTFSGVRGQVVSGSSTLLRVVVPPCLPTTEVVVRLQIGVLDAGSAPLSVVAGNTLMEMEVGEDRTLDASEALACFRLPSIPYSRYLLVPHTTGTVGGAQYQVDVMGLVGEDPPSGSPGRDPSARVSRPAPPSPLDTHWEWESRLRRREREILSAETGVWRRGPLRERAPGKRSLPSLGDSRDFSVLNAEDEFDEVRARVRYISDRSIIYVDEDTPPNGFTDDDNAFFASQFDDPIHPTVTGAFGSESDLDGNERVIILFTPAVNRLTPDGSDGYVAGFFFGVDLVDGTKGSNGGEVFYAVVPDGTGAHGPILGRNSLLTTLPAILAHEFEHMVHYNQRILRAGADRQEALWLSEALAQMAEDLVGMAYAEMGVSAWAKDYQRGNWSRARRFLLDPAHVSVLAAEPPGTLAERGAGWLLLKHLYGREGQNELLQALTSSTRTGLENLERVVGRSWEEIVGDWVGSLFLDGIAVPVRDGLRVEGVNLRAALSLFDGRFPLEPSSPGATAFLDRESLWSSAPGYYILTTPERGGLAVNVSGAEGRPPDSGAGLRVLLVRLQ